MMITVYSNKIKTFSQDNYNKLVNSININQITCSCGHCGCLTKHAYYTRSLKISGGIKLSLSILRIKCSLCGKTHAILPSGVVPYSQVSLRDHIIIIANDINKKRRPLWWITILLLMKVPLHTFYAVLENAGSNA